MAEFFAMGGYAFHVWTCWGASLLSLGGLVVYRRSRFNAAKARAEAAIQASQSEGEQS